ncbi:hypothetical protein KA005_57375, partial [bacterium]|nr:hypothetical protein [bacterium]
MSDQLRQDRDKVLQQILKGLIEQGLNGTQVSRLVERPALYTLGFLDGLVAAGLLKVHQVGRSNVFEIKDDVKESIKETTTTTPT